MLVTRSKKGELQSWDSMAGPRHAAWRDGFIVWRRSVLLVALLAAGPWHALAEAPDFVWMKGGHRGLTAIGITPDSQTVVTGGADDETIKIWQASDGELLRTINAFLGRVNDLAISPDGQIVAAAGDEIPGYDDVQVKVFRISDGTLVLPIDAGLANATQIAYSPDGSKIAVGTANSLVEVFDATDGSPAWTADAGFDLAVGGLAFSPDGQLLAAGGSVSFTGTVKLFAVADGNPMGTMTDTGAFAVNALDFSHDGTRLAMGSIFDGAVHVRLVSNGSLVQTFSGQLESVWTLAYSPDGQHVAVGGDYSNPDPPPFSLGLVELHNSTNGAIEHALDGSAFSVAFSADSSKVLAGGAESIGIMWDVVTGDPLTTFGFFAAQVSAVAYAPNGQAVATGAYDRSVRIWQADDGTLLHDLVGHQDVVNCTGYSPDGAILASGSGAGGFDTVDPSIKLWNTATGGLIRTLAGHSGGTFSAAFSPDGATLASGGSELSGIGTLKLWRASDGALLRTINIPEQNPVVGLAWTPDGLMIATAHGDIRLWRVSDGGLDHIIAPNDVIDALVMSTDGATVAGSSQVLNAARVWNTATGAFVRSFVGPPEGVGLSSVTYSHDGATLAAGSGYMRALYFWRFDDATLLTTLDQETGWGIAPVTAPMAFSPDDRRFVFGRTDAACALARNRLAGTPGDMNCDGSVDFADINPFVLYLSNFAAWQTAYPGCPAQNGDINGDGSYPDFGDINPFVALLTGL